MSLGSSRVMEWRQRTKVRAVVYKGGCCLACGYNRYVGALDFHHTDPATKTAGIAEMLRSPQAWTTIRAELDKCVILCNRCHAEVHGGALDLRSHIFRACTVEEGLEFLRRWWGTLTEAERCGLKAPIKGLRKTCPVCGGLKAIKATVCAACYRPQEKIQWPSDLRLREMLAASNFSAVARDLGVSDNAIRKRLQR
jgi:hypothetical protein